MKKLTELMDEIIKTDILVVGGGLAGCMAAIEAFENSVNVVLAVEGKVGKSGCTPLAGGPGGADFMVDSASVASVLGLEDLGPEKPDPRDNPELFKKDILKDGRYLNNQRMLDVYVTEAPKRMKRLMDLGLRITQVTSAHEVRFPRGVIALNTDISATLIKNIRERSITLLEDTKITDILTREGKCVGAIGVKIKSGNILMVKSKAVIIATGAWQMAYRSGGSDELTGDGQAMAFRAGAELIDMEFSTFMDRYLIWPPFASRDNFIWKRNVERKLVNREGNDILSNVPVEKRRTESARIVSKEVAEGKGSEHDGVYLMNPDETIGNGYIKMEDLLSEQAHDDIKFEIGVGSHYFNGGIKVNEKTETVIPGLYSAGEASGGLFGAKRVASALSEATIQGSIAGEVASKYVANVGNREPEIEQVQNILERLISPLKRGKGIKPVELRKSIRRISLKSLSLYRNSSVLLTALKEIIRMRKEDVPRLWVSGTKSRIFNKEWMECLSVENLLLCLEACTRSAMMREESRGFHLRSDFPEENEAWLSNIVVRKRGEMMVNESEPIVITTMPPRRD